MTASTCVVFIAVGAAVVALWVDVRLPNLMPVKLGRLVAHVAVALMSVYVIAPAMQTVIASGIRWARLVAVFTIGFPALVYYFLIGAWLIKVMQARARGFQA